MQKLLFLFLLIGCTQEYNFDKKGGVPGPVVTTDTATVTEPPLVVLPPHPGEADPYAQIHIEPYDYDFGEVEVNCEYEYDVVVSSTGTGPLVIDNIDYLSTPELSLATEYDFPLSIEPGENITFTFKFNEVDTIPDTGRMYIYSNALGKTSQMITNQGVGKPSGNQVDVFTQEEISKADILFVVDNSCSMTDEQAGLADNAESFIDDLIDAGVDFQISVITTDDPTPVSPIITPDSADPVTDFSRAVSVGNSGDPTEQGQEMAKQALDPMRGSLAPGVFQREDAALSVVVVSDEDDFSPLTELEYYDFFLSIKEEELFFFHSVVSLGFGCGTATGDRYVDQSNLTGGTYLDICGFWGDNLNTIANSNYIIQTEYPLSKLAIRGTVEVFVDGEPLEDGWYYDITLNSVILEDKTTLRGDEMFQVMYDYLDECPY